jgi:hypothetical protein
MSFVRRLKDFAVDTDDKYSRLIESGYNRLPDNSIGRAVKSAGYMVGGASPSFQGPAIDTSANPSKISKLMGHAIPAANAVTKYGLPAAGLTAAGLALNGWTNELNNIGTDPEKLMVTHTRPERMHASLQGNVSVADEPEANALGLNDTETAALAALMLTGGLGGGVGIGRTLKR